jgi:RNA polymerase sigma-70 factor (ECF subfamily)
VTATTTITSSNGPASALARFERLFRDYQRAVLAYAIRRTPTLADAEDAAAETFTIAWRKIDAVPTSEPLPWLYAVARRVLANQRRGTGRRERLATLLRVEDVPTPMRIGDAQDGPAFAALATLAPADQEVLRLVAWEDLSNQQIAAVLGITPNAVAIRLHRARARFADALARATPDEDLKHLDPSRTSTDVTGTHGAARTGAMT